MKHKSLKDQAQTPNTSPKKKRRVAQSQPFPPPRRNTKHRKKTRGHATDSTETAAGTSTGFTPESHRNHEPSPEINEIKSSPDHPIHLTTGNYRELTMTTEKPPPTTVLKITVALT
ncbi:hypothetical protein HID58_023517 [Brassica napus]|uniref:Uncharacterized protein n=1 Tax=Brassica napus TaxID=3708 RepID=A0ABQ8D2A4_BRANA|nr:hypothetical protein HID58_023517 [Brassica napus]